VKLKELLSYNLRAVRAYLLREDFQRFWLYRSPFWAGRFMKEWCTRVMRSKLEPMKKVAQMIRSHEALILNWFRGKGTISAAAVEGLNNKVKLVMRRSYGFRTKRAIEIALYHNLGKLPEPHFTHESAEEALFQGDGADRRAAVFTSPLRGGEDLQEFPDEPLIPDRTGPLFLDIK